MRWAVQGFAGVMLTTMVAMTAGATQFTGSYVAEQEPGVTLELQEAAGGVITGTLSSGGALTPLNARRVGTGFTGTLGPADANLPLTGAVQGERLVLDFGAPDAPPEEQERLMFVRAGAGKPGSAGAARKVVINGKRLSDAEVARAEQAYRVRIADADYWYDPVLGAWGARGGPTMGFIAPGLDLGGPLPADASGGGTAVFVNGRALHPYDLAALQQITGPIAPGRYFITSQGLAGLEGGPPLWNLAALAAQAQGGGSNTWQSRVTGASGFSDGTTGAVFLLNGGIVSTGN